MQGRSESEQIQQASISAKKPIGYTLRWFSYWDNFCNSKKLSPIIAEPVSLTQISPIPEAPKSQNMDNDANPVQNRCTAVKDCIKDSAVIGVTAGAALSSLTLLPVCFAYCAYQKREEEAGKMENDASCYLACLACLSASPCILAGDCLSVTLSIFASPFVACAGKEPDCIKTTSKRAINL